MYKRQVVEYEETAEPPADPTRTDYIFTGWFTDNGYTTKWDDTAPIYQNTDVYAGWIPARYTVSFNTDGGSPVPSQSVEYEGYATRPADPTKDGYIIKEWQLNGVVYNFDVPVTEDITLTAVWDKVWTVTFDADGGSPVPDPQIVVDGNVVESLPAEPTKDDCTFGGWYDASGDEPDCPEPLPEIQVVTKVVVDNGGCGYVDPGEMFYTIPSNPPYQILIPKTDLVADLGGLNMSNLTFTIDGTDSPTFLDAGDNIMVNGQISASGTATIRINYNGQELATIPVEITDCNGA